MNRQRIYAKDNYDVCMFSRANGLWEVCRRASGTDTMRHNGWESLHRSTTYAEAVRQLAKYKRS